MSDLRMAAHGETAAPVVQLPMREQIARMEEAFDRAMPRGGDAAQLVRDAHTLVSANPRLLECDGRSLLGGLMTCAQLGLRPGIPALGHAHLIPFKNSAQLIVGYQGYLVLLHRSGQIASVEARVVHEGDVFGVEYGTNSHLLHRPNFDIAGAPTTGFYSVVKTTNGGMYWEFMTQSAVENHRDKFAMAKKNGEIVGPWVDHFEAMAKKTVLLKTMNLAPKSAEFLSALEADNKVHVAPINEVVVGAAN